MKWSFKICFFDFNKRPYRERIIFLIGSLFLIYAAFYFLVFQPLNRVSTSFNPKISTLQHSIQDLRERKAKLDILLLTSEETHQQRIAFLKNQMSKLKTSASPNPRWAENKASFNEILSLLVKSGPFLSRPDIVQLPTERKPSLPAPLIYRPIQLTFYGTYFATMEYLHYVADLPWIMSIDSFRYRVTTYPYAKVQMTVSLLSTEEGFS